MANENLKFADAIFEELEADRRTGKLKKEVLENGGNGISPNYPDYIAIGHYADGAFQASKTF
jgi:hypothetical protein